MLKGIKVVGVVLHIVFISAENCVYEARLIYFPNYLYFILRLCACPSFSSYFLMGIDPYFLCLEYSLPFTFLKSSRRTQTKLAHEAQYPNLSTKLSF